MIFHHNLYSQYEFENADSVINYLEGEWEWVSSCGGITYHCIDPKSEGYSRILVFNRIENVSDSIKIISYLADTLLFQSGSKIDGEQFLSWNLTHMFWKIEAESENKVLFRDMGADGFERLYERKVPVYMKEEIELKTNLKIYPNHCANSLRLNLKNHDIIEYVCIFDTGGYEILYLKNYRINDLIDISNLPKGLYFVRVVADDMEFVEKFLKE